MKALLLSLLLLAGFNDAPPVKSWGNPPAYAKLFILDSYGYDLLVKTAARAPRDTKSVEFDLQMHKMRLTVVYTYGPPGRPDLVRVYPPMGYVSVPKYQLIPKDKVGQFQIHRVGVS